MSQARESYVIRRSGEKDLKFSGKVLGAVSSQGPDLFGDRAREWTGPSSVARWRELVVYVTNAGATICHEARMTRNAGEVDTHRAEVIGKGSSPPTDTSRVGERIVGFFGRDALAKRLFDVLGIEDAESID